MMFSMWTGLAERSVVRAAMLLSFVLPMCAQESLISISVEPRGAPYQVDGVMYYAPTSFTWPTGSKHTLAMMTTCAGPNTVNACDTRYQPLGWTTVQGGKEIPIDPESSFAVITADSRITAYIGRVDVKHLVRVSFFDAGGGTSSRVDFPRTECMGDRPGPGGPGIVCIDGECYRESVDLWLPAGPVTLNAIPYNGFIFRAWYTGTAGQPFVNTYTVTGPTLLHARFEPAKRVVVATDPPELRVLVDTTNRPTGDPNGYVPPTCAGIGIFDFAEGSTHVFAVPSPQMDANGTQWVFDKWSNGGGQNMVYKAEQANLTDTLIAKFVRGVRVNLMLPKGLKLIVDGRDTWTSYDFSWAAGSRHVVTAPPEQTDENGRKYVFKGWSNGAAATQEINVSSSDFSGTTIRAEYEMLGLIKVHSNAPVTIQIGDDACQTPCVLHRSAGTEVGVSVPKTIPISEGSRWDLQSVNGGTSDTQTTKFTAEGSLLVANYRPMHRVSVAAEPANGATVRLEPSSPDGFYPPNTRVQVYATSKLGYRFKQWGGDTSARFSPATVSVSGPLRLTAILEAVPEISPTGVKNGAGDTPVNGVAPGSIISIYGVNLASSTEVGPGNPLKQTLGGVTVHVAGRILPLFFVSPDQINAQLPYDLPLDVHSLTVKSRGTPDLATTFETVRNAPGLLTSQPMEHSVAVVTRANGGPAVTSANPVKSGELINVFGTGFGPHRVAPPEGFGASEVDGYRLVDPVQIVIGDQAIVPEYAGVAAGLPGVVAVRFRAPATLSGDTPTTFNVVVNGVRSNDALLPTAAAYSAKTEQ
jgi:uncharacterized protein (TIGR03437 family)